MQNIQWDLAQLDQAEQARREEPLDLAHDPLVLSWNRYHREQQGLSSLDLQHLLPNQQDHDMAAACSRYYQDKIMLYMLRGRTLTPFQTELYQLLTQGARRKHEGMLYRLPYFYVEDQQREKLQEQFAASLFRPIDTAEPVLRELKPVSLITCYRKSGHTREYWWKDDHAQPVCWPVASQNSLASLVHGLWHQPDGCSLISRFRVGRRADWPYLLPVHPQLRLAA